MRGAHVAPGVHLAPCAHLSPHSDERAAGVAGAAEWALTEAGAGPNEPMRLAPLVGPPRGNNW